MIEAKYTPFPEIHIGLSYTGLTAIHGVFPQDPIRIVHHNIAPPWGASPWRSVYVGDPKVRPIQDNPFNYRAQRLYINAARAYDENHPLINIEESEKGVTMAPHVMEVEELINSCFPEKDIEWKRMFAEMSGLMIRRIAKQELKREPREVGYNYKQARLFPDDIDIYPNDEKYRIVAAISGSVARTLISGEKDAGDGTHRAIQDLKRESPEVKELFRSTGKYDLDIACFPNTDVQDIFNALCKESQIDAQTDGHYRRARVTGDNSLLPANTELILFKTRAGLYCMKMIFNPVDDEPFSIDLSTLPRRKEEKKDDHRWQSQSSKRKVTVPVVARNNTKKDGIDVGVADSPRQVLKKVDMMNAWSHIENIGDAKFAQILLALSAMIRVELLSATVYHEIYDTDVYNLADYLMPKFVAYVEECINIGEMPMDEKENIDWRRDCFITMINDPKTFLTIYKSLGLDLLLGNASIVQYFDRELLKSKGKKLAAQDVFPIVNTGFDLKNPNRNMLPQAARLSQEEQTRILDGIHGDPDSSLYNLNTLSAKIHWLSTSLLPGDDDKNRHSLKIRRTRVKEITGAGNRVARYAIFPAAGEAVDFQLHIEGEATMIEALLQRAKQTTLTEKLDINHDQWIKSIPRAESFISAVRTSRSKEELLQANGYATPCFCIEIYVYEGQKYILLSHPMTLRPSEVLELARNSFVVDKSLQ